MATTIESPVEPGGGAPLIREFQWRPGPVADVASVTATTPQPGDQAIPPPSTDRVDVQSLYGILRAGKDAGNRIAADIRSLGQVRDLVHQVSTALESIVKSFPPFPPGSDERERFLESVAGIRAMIERLSFPPAQRQAVANTLTDVPFVDGSATDQSMAAGLDQLGKLEIKLGTIHAQLGESASIGIPDSSEEPYYVNQSQSVGKALYDGNLSIGGKMRYAQEILS